MKYSDMTVDQLNLKYMSLLQDYEFYKKRNIKLDMSRGKPSVEQLDLSMDMLNINIFNDYIIDNIDVRNYGCLDGIPSVKNLFAQILGVDKNEIIIGGNSSLNMMHDIVGNLMLNSSLEDSKPWCKLKEIKFLCPVPGYDRHFNICEKFGISMINVDMTNKGPDMDQVENLVNEDITIKGIWCVPQYSNPTGITYSEETVCRLASLRPKANDFKIFWDNAYVLHHLYDKYEPLVNILQECKKRNNQDMVYIFSSTSKITFPGSGLSVIAASNNNINQIKKWINVQTIGYDKINQLRHLLFFKNIDNLKMHMKRHADILRPKFQMADDILSENLNNTGLATWSKPLGGYFVSIDTLEGCAKRVVKLCGDLGVTFTDAGATFPYKNDPKDSNIRVAVSYPKLEELKIAMMLLCLSIKIASLEKFLKINKEKFKKVVDKYNRL